MSIMFHARLIIHSEFKVRDDYIRNLLKREKIHSVDILELPNTAKVGIDKVREIIAYLHLKPFASALKSVILEGENLTPEAQQALLKSFEEPPPHNLLIISSVSASGIIPTLGSRCQIVNLKQQIGDVIKTEFNEDKFWSEILTLNPLKRLTYTQAIAKDRSAVENWLKSQLIFLRRKLLALYDAKQGEFPLTAGETTQTVRAFVKAFNYSRSNVTIKLLLDHLFLEIPYVNPVKSIEVDHPY